MPTVRNKMPDSLSLASSAGTGIGQVSPRKPADVRTAQLVVASHVSEPDDLREVLQALGICNRERRIQEIVGKRPTGTRRQPSQRGLARDHRFEGEREPNGRLSRRSRARGEM